MYALSFQFKSIISSAKKFKEVGAYIKLISFRVDNNPRLTDDLLGAVIKSNTCLRILSIAYAGNVDSISEGTLAKIGQLAQLEFASFFVLSRIFVYHININGACPAVPMLMILWEVCTKFGVVVVRFWWNVKLYSES